MPSTPLVSMVERLDESRNILISHIDSLDQPTLDWNPSESKWSVGEVIHHIILVDNAVTKLLGRIIERDGKSDSTPSEADVNIRLFVDFENHVTEYPVFQSAAPEHGIERSRLRELLLTSRQELVDLFIDREDEDLGHFSFPHPALGRLNVYQWLLFDSVHERGHVKQIRSILDIAP